MNIKFPLWFVLGSFSTESGDWWFMRAFGWSSGVPKLPPAPAPVPEWVKQLLSIYECLNVWRNSTYTTLTCIFRRRRASTSATVCGEIRNTPAKSTVSILFHFFKTELKINHWINRSFIYSDLFSAGVSQRKRTRPGAESGVEQLCRRQDGLQLSTKPKPAPVPEWVKKLFL